MSEFFLVWSHQHSAWWGPGCCGYVTDHTKASRYTRAGALSICRNALPGQWKPGAPFPELPVHEADIAAMLMLERG
jgi:hypothetical protein